MIMAFDRYDPRDMRRDERSRWPDDDRFSRRERAWREDGGHRGERDDRGFFERAGDEISSWFGDDEAERRRREDRMRFERDDERFRHRGRDYRPMTGDYGRTEHEAGQYFAGSGFDRGERGFSERERERERGLDPHYRSWRDRHLSELDRDYDDYRRENQSRFESEFGSWREQRQQKRGLLGTIREHMEVIGSDDEHVGTIDKVAGDRIILTKSDPESGGVHHSLSCSEIDRVEGDRVILDCSAEQARNRWRDENRSRALFERDDQGEMGPRVLDRSFEGTYRR